MAIENIPINSGTGPKIAVDSIGTVSYQVVKVLQASDGATGSLGNVFYVTNTGTANVAVANTPTITISTALGTIAVSGGGGGAQYPINTTAMANTATGTIMLCMQSGATTARGLLVTATGGVSNIQNVATITTLLGTVAVSGGGGGAQYTINATNMGATATGTIIFGMQGGATTARGLALTTTGGILDVATVSTLLGTVAVSGAFGGAQYTVDTTAIGATGTGTLLIGIQSGATTARGFAITTTGAGHSHVVNTVTITGTVGANMLQKLDATNDSISVYGVQTGSAAKVQVLVSTSGGLYIASGGGGGVQYEANTTAMGATGTGNIILGMQSGATTARSLLLHTTGGIIIASGGGGGVQYQVDTTAMAATATGTIILGMQSGATTARGLTLSTTGGLFIASGAFVATAHASRWDAYAVSTTSGAGLVAIVKTSGAHTLYVTDVMVSVDVPMAVTLYSSTGTAKSVVYLATKGGFALSLNTPMVLNSAQSLCFQGNLSGSAACFAAGYTVT